MSSNRIWLNTVAVTSFLEAFELQFFEYIVISCNPSIVTIFGKSRCWLFFITYTLLSSHRHHCTMPTPLPPLSASLTPSNINPDEIVAQTLTYMNALDEHALAVRSHPERAVAYRRILNERRVLQPDTKILPLSLDNRSCNKLRRRMEDIIKRPATSVDEYVSRRCSCKPLIMMKY